MNTRNPQIELIEQRTKAESTLNIFLTLSVDLFCLFEQDRYCQPLNPAWEKVLGWTSSEVRSRPWIEFVHPDDVEVTLSAQSRYPKEDLVEYENRCRHKDGSYRWLSWRVSKVEDELSYAVAKDITVTKQTQKALNSCEALWQNTEHNKFEEQNLPRAVVELTEWHKRYEIVSQISNQLLYEWNFLTDELLWGQNVEQVLGYHKAELEGGMECWNELIHPDDLDNKRQEITRVLATQEPIDSKYRVRKKDGTYITVEDKGQFYSDGGSNVNRIVGCIIDISERLRTESALRESEERWQLALRGNNDGIWDLHIKNNQVFYSARWKEMLGYEEHELPNNSEEWKKRVHPDDIDWVTQLCREHIEGKTPYFIAEYRMRCKDGSYKWILDRGQALRDETGSLVRIIGSHTDISDRKQAERSLQQALVDLEKRVEERTKNLQQVNERLSAEIAERQRTELALRQSEKRYRAIIEDQTELICRFKPDDTLTFVNDAYCRYFGKPRESLIGQKFLPAMPPEDRKLITQNFRSLSLEKPTNTYEHRVILPSGEIRWQQWSDRALFDEEGNFIECQAVGRDITQLKQAEADIRMALAKERELSELRSGFVSLVSHEFRTPLTTIQSSTELLEFYSNKLSDEKKQKHLTRIQTAVLRMTQLLDDVLTIGQVEAGKLKFNPSPTDLVAFCRDIIESMHFSARPHHTLNFVTHGDCTDAQIDEKLLGHIVTNLLSNAIKYSPKGCTIQFDLICNASEAVFRIQDTGIGIPTEDLEKLFDSFRRASNVGTIQGTGLGLAIVKNCVDLHRGTIAVESEIGVGTTFTVTLPLNSHT